MEQQPSLGARVHHRRAILGLTLRDLARRANIGSPSFVLYIENGSRIPSPAVARRLAIALSDDPSLYEAWARLLGRTSPRAALAAAQRILEEQSAAPLDVISLVDAPPRTACLRVPVIAAGADPGTGLRPECPVFETLRIPWSLLPANTSLPYAAPLEGDWASRVPELAGRGLALLVRDHAWPEPRSIHAVRMEGGVRLARVLWNGRALLVLPAPGADDFEVLHAQGDSPAPLLAGRPIRILER
jgi:transcriptional regulator with XRE-family HTH domain